MTKWDYRILEVAPGQKTEKELTELLDRMGNEGWECFSIQNERLQHGSSSTNVMRYYFKRGL